jgi:soluble lytic murein transglycosylase-like protein
MSVTTQYDTQIQQAVQQWLPEWMPDWQWLKAQFYQESLLQTDAVSPAGAKGLPQFMDPTWSDVRQRLMFPSSASPFDPKFSIPGGVYYTALMRGGWGAPRSEDDRRKLAFASYNAGFGNILEAQKLSGGKADYDSIISELHNVTGPQNAAQTTTYVERIYQYFQQFTTEAAP